ncbi:hypothetical protein AK830_g5691 [Neonectria ditissima]|uniref:Phytocyanin domain-containing protein n=1 Tax=Neonectria ditissima TaxID=78410 RepID=A0A0N8H755_9HYPO|nr:hypothetical protein AK830_g5691 [Neonectria ditissima]
MHLFSLNLALVSLLAAKASAETHKVEVGKDGEVFDPETIKAAKGDVVEFHFDSKHSVVAGDFKKPCNPLSTGGFYSGSLPSGGKVSSILSSSNSSPCLLTTIPGKSYFSVTINNTEPIFFYCSVNDHCQEGMVGVINQGSSDTLSSYKSAAAKASSNVSPKAEFGGTVADKSGQSTTTITTTKASTTVTTTSTGTSTATTTSGNAADHLTGPVSGAGFFALVLAVFLG